MKMATSLHKMIVLSVISALFLYILGDFNTSAASFAIDGQEKGSSYTKGETSEWKLFGDSGFTGENSDFDGGKRIGSLRRSLRDRPRFDEPASPKRAYQHNFAPPRPL